ncbi:electrogenic sodium bicarbonate cotransporter 1-like isoform X2 [Mercenaria mercenaria]|uniref:electrogenic sodium bicarbonate cotransporter 1-like isoform X2 n=1 Tax=Mercenaria mercenaria TaxID=6596 RepID=UPI00234E709C|nr:electrogenic sodium bicarbonate cotransporter 1-like isoform X2 [Mercenaria mercenaria]XP_053386030.1 electrogenic sodium bicarbonate cotransporter 1-like isoform X2 [Mercenaria mercenaria]
MSEEQQKLMEEGVKDRGIGKDLSNNDLEDTANKHRMVIGVRLPKRPKRPRKSRRRKDKSGDGTALMSTDYGSPTDYMEALQSPTETVQNLLGEVDDEQHQPHGTFCQLDLLYTFGQEKQWREFARWVKYEEDVEEGGERWSKPHVASLSLHALFELRSTILNGAVVLDLDAYHITQIIDIVLDTLVAAKTMSEENRDDVRKALMSPHVFAHEKRKRSLMPGSESDRALKKNFSKGGKLTPNRSFSNVENINGDIKETYSSAKLNVDFMRKVPPDSQACNVMVGELSCLKYQVAAFIRLSEARNIGDITEVPIPTRFVFILLGPPGSEDKCIEIGRSMSTVMVDEIYREVAYKARNRTEILTGLDEFLDQVTVLPPGEWDPKIRIEPPEKVPSQQARKTQKTQIAGPHVLATQEAEHESHDDPTLVRTGRLFGGLIADIKRKVPWYPSDFKDALHVQCIASTIFLFLATLTPNVTFGGLLGQATDQYMGAMECILSAAIVGVLFALFSGQPLNILGSTGPMLVLEMILYNFCKDGGYDFLPLRCWIGLWTTGLLVLVVAFDLSALVRYITRFTEESFACLIAIIFIYEAFKKQFHIIDHYGINKHPEIPIPHDCTCMPPSNATNATMDGNMTTVMDSFVAVTTTPLVNFTYSNETMYDIFSGNMTWADLNKEDCLKYNGTLHGEGCEESHLYPDVFFLSCLLFLGTYTLAMTLKDFKTAPYFPSFVRQMVSDFAVLLSIVIMVGIDVLVGIKTPKLEVPAKFQPTRYQDRGWFINPISEKNPWWTAIAAVIPAFLALVLIFMDQQITAVIVNRKENKLKKGNGYHLDLLVVAVCIAICSLLGLPWYVAATVSAIAHIMSLKKESETAAPGEKPMFLGCREQRVTALLVGILSGCAVLLTGVLTMIPMPVLYGVFLYMGVAALKGMQFIDRLGLLFMPAKYQPDSTYLRHVKINRIHLFTFLQIICLGVLWVVKMVKAISIAFPVMVVGTCFVRKAMDKLFTQYELSYLDDLMPSDDKNKEEDEKKNFYGDPVDDDELEKDEREVMMDMKMKHTMGDKFGGYMAVPNNDRVNISEEMSKTGIWMQVRRDSVPVLEGMNNSSSQQPNFSPLLNHSERHHFERIVNRRNGSKANFMLGDGDIPEENEGRESKI